MPFLEILRGKYSDDSRDYTKELMAHRLFEVVLAEAYECKILSNPWLASSTAAKQSVIETTEPSGLRADITSSAPQEVRPQESSPLSAEILPAAPSDNNANFPEEKSTPETTNETKSVDKTHSENQLDAAAVLASLEQSTALSSSAPPITKTTASESNNHPAISVVEAVPPAPPPHPLASISTSDATFGEPLRAKFLAAANLVRYNHGVTTIKEPGDDAQLDCIIHEVILAYQKLKVRLLKASNHEAQFRLDIETRVANGIWNQYDVGSYTDDFVVYKTSGRRLGREQNQPQRTSGRSGRSGIFDDDEDDSHDDDDCTGSRGAWQPSSSRDAKRTASGKFEKSQVLPLTEWLLKHSANPYPSMDDKADLAAKSGLSPQQVQNWFINMRKRHWTPMMNGKRRPRTFLDYVILSSQQGEGEAHAGGGPGSRKLRGAAAAAEDGGDDGVYEDEFRRPSRQRDMMGAPTTESRRGGQNFGGSRRSSARLSNSNSQSMDVCFGNEDW